MEQEPNTTPPVAPTPEVTASPKPKRRRRWLRFAAIALGVLLLLVVLLPTIGTSRLVLGPVERKLATITGTTVRIEGVRFGWVSHLTLRTFELGPAKPGEPPMVLLEGVRVPLNLRKILAMPPYDLSGIEVDTVRVHSIRRSDGRTNWEDLLASVQAALPPPPGVTPDTTAATDPPPAAEFPPTFLHDKLRKLGVTVRDITILHEDHALPVPLITGIESGTLVAEFPAVDDTLLLRLRTPLRSNDRIEPIESEVRIGGLLAPADGGALTVHVTTSSALANARLDLVMHSATELQATGEWTLHLAPMVAFAAATAPVAIEGISLTGDVSGDFSVEGDLAGPLTFTLNHTGTPLVVELPMLPHPLNLSETAMALSGSVNVATQRIELLEAAGEFPGGHGTMRVDQASALPLSPEFSASLTSTVDLGEIAQIAALAFDPDAKPMLTESSIETTVELGAEESGALAGVLRVAIRGGLLHTLAPFAEDPPILADGPLSLSATDAQVVLPIRATLDGSTVTIERMTWDFGEWMRGGLSAQASLADPESPTVALQLEHEMVLDHLGAILADVGVELPATLSGFVGVAVQANGQPLGIMTGSVDLAVEHLTMTMPDQPLLVQDESLHAYAVFETRMDTATFILTESCLEHAAMELTATGEASVTGGALIMAESTIHLPALLDYVYRVMPELELLLEGALFTNVTIAADATGMQLSAVTHLRDGYVETPQTGLLSLPLSGGVDATVDITGDAPIVHLDSLGGDLGRFASVGASGTFLEGRHLDLSANASADLEQLLAWVPPHLLEETGATVELQGLAEAIVLLTVTLPEDEHTRPAVHALTTLHAEIPDVLWTFGEELLGEIGGIASHSTILATISHDLSVPPAFSITSESSITAMRGPSGVSMDEAAVSLELAGTAEQLELTTMGTVAELRHEADGATFAIHTIHAGTSLSLDVPAEILVVHEAVTSIADELQGSATLTIRGWSNPESGRITTDANLEIADVGSLIQWYTIADPVAMPEIHGQFRQQFALDGPLDPRPFLATGVIPYVVSSAGAFSGGSFAIAETATVPDIAADWTFAVESGSVSAELTGNTGVLTGPSLPMALGPMRLHGSAALDNLDRLRITLHDAGAAIPRADATGEIVVSGLAAVLRESLSATLEERPAELPRTPEEWMRMVRVTVDSGAEVTLAELSGIVPELELEGTVAGVLRMDSSDELLRVTMEAQPSDVALRFGELFAMDGLNGASSFRKTVSLLSSGRRATLPDARRMRIANILASKGPFAVRIGNLAADISGVDGGIRLEGRSPDFAGGTAMFAATLQLVDGIPILNAEAHCTGMETRTLSTAFAGEGRSAGRVDTFLRLRWELRRDIAAMLDGMDFSMQVPTIHPRALMELIRILDPKGAHPGMQAGRMALNFGSPRAVTLKLRNGLTSLSVEVAPAFGPSALLVLLERVPIGDLTGVVDTDTLGPLIKLANAGLVLLLAPDLSTMLQQVELILAEPTP